MALVTYDDEKVQVADMKTALDKDFFLVKKVETVE